MRGKEGGGGAGLEPKNLCTKNIAQINLSFCKFHYFPQNEIWVHGGGGGNPPPPVVVSCSNTSLAETPHRFRSVPSSSDVCPGQCYEHGCECCGAPCTAELTLRHRAPLITSPSAQGRTPATHSSPVQPRGRILVSESRVESRASIHCLPVSVGGHHLLLARQLLVLVPLYVGAIRTVLS